MSGPMTRKRLRDAESRDAESNDNSRKAEETKKAKSEIRTRADIAREAFVNRLVGFSKVDDPDTYCRLLEQDLFPATCPIAPSDGIRPNEAFSLSGRMFSRPNLSHWVQQFKDKSTRPTCPMTRDELSAEDLADLSFNTSDFVGWNQPKSAPVTEPSAPPVAINFSDKESISNSSDIDVVTQIIRLVDSPHDEIPNLMTVTQRMVSGNCQTFLITFCALFAPKTSLARLWSFVNETSIDWKMCWNALFDEKTQIAKDFATISKATRLVDKVFFAEVLECLKASPNRQNLLLDFINSLQSIPSNLKSEHRVIVAQIIDIASSYDIDYTLESIDVLFRLSLRWLCPILALIQKHYVKLRAEEGKKTLRKIWLYIAQFDRFRQSPSLDAYLCGLPDDMVETFVQTAIQNHSNICAIEYYRRYKRETAASERFFAQKTAIECENVVFLQQTFQDYSRDAPKDRLRVLVMIAVEFSSLVVVKSIFNQQQHVREISCWLDLLCRVAPSRYDVFRYIWSHHHQYYLQNRDDDIMIENMEELLLFFCRNGNVQALSFVLNNSTVLLLRRYHQQLFLACCSSSFAVPIFNTLFEFCSKTLSNFSLLFCNGVLLIRAASVGCHQIVKRVVSEVLASRALSDEIQNRLITTCVIETVKHSHRRAFFAVWSSFRLSPEAMPVSSRDAIMAAASLCKDDYILEMLGVN